MIAIPAVDIRSGACVQLVGGDFAREPIRIEDPLRVAQDWAGKGFKWLHVVDLDAAIGAGSNTELIQQILSTVPSRVSVGGGIRTRLQIESFIEKGAARVILGSRIMDDRGWLRSVASDFPGRIIAAADVRERTVLTDGWRTRSQLRLENLVAELNEMPLAGVLVTAVHLEGQQAGTDMRLFKDLMRMLTLPLIASGGVTTMQDIARLSAMGVSAAVIGMALYTGALQADLVATEYGR